MVLSDLSGETKNIYLCPHILDPLYTNKVHIYYHYHRKETQIKPPRSANNTIRQARVIHRLVYSLCNPFSLNVMLSCSHVSRRVTREKKEKDVTRKALLTHP